MYAHVKNIVHMFQRFLLTKWSKICVPATLSRPRQKRSDRLRAQQILSPESLWIYMGSNNSNNHHPKWYVYVCLWLSLPHYLDALKGPMNENISKSISHMVGLSTSWWWSIPQMASEKPLFHNHQRLLWMAFVFRPWHLTTQGMGIPGL